MPKVAKGDEVPTPKVPVVGKVNVPVVSFTTVEVAGNTPKRRLPMLSWLLPEAEVRNALYPKARLLWPVMLANPVVRPY